MIPGAPAAGTKADLRGTGRLADELYLIAHHDRTGRARLQPRATGLGLASALLAELAIADRITIGEGWVGTSAGNDPADALGRRLLDQVAAEPEPHGVADWLAALAAAAAEDVAGRLSDAGYLERRPAAWGRSGRWVPTDSSCAFTPVIRAAGALRPSRPLTVPGATLAALADACGLGPLVMRHAADGARSPEDAAAFLPPALQYLIAQTRAAVDAALLAHRR
ncbi:MAG TPA: GPP34 family phosphoprotein [Streptosporangiaceae bacterium]|nr:GPP34 family phosphoprotein [Streptosporangiaceae bacterium]